LAVSLAGEDGMVVPIESFGVRTLRRALSQAEVHYLRRALLGLAPGEPLAPRRSEEELLGLICSGRALHGTGPAMVAVADHANLTWRSPLRGPDDETLGPRFPVVAGLYRPEEVLARLGSSLLVAEVACVHDDGSPTGFERETAEKNGLNTLSTELAPVALVAAHLGFHLAALVLETGEDG
jgi:hypothetical protein